MSINIPNILTLSRILLIPFIIYFHQSNQLYFSLALLVICLLTDFFDGYFARRLKQETYFGALFDPIADKIIGLVFYSYLFYINLVPSWFACILILRNFSQLMSIPILIWWLKRKFFVKPNKFAKWATALSDIFIPVPLYLIPFGIIDREFLFVPMIILSISELRIIQTYIPRLVAIATLKHDTFE